MDARGQIYFDEESEIPKEDLDRLRAAQAKEYAHSVVRRLAELQEAEARAKDR